MHVYDALDVLSVDRMQHPLGVINGVLTPSKIMADSCVGYAQK
jgi:hypothetical protein